MEDKKSDSVLEQLSILSNKVDSTNELVKMILISNVINKTDTLFEDSGLIIYDSIDENIAKKFELYYHLEQYLIAGTPCVFMIPKQKMKMKTIHLDYISITEHDVCCVIVFESMTTYEIRRCKELKLNWIDLQHRTIIIRY